MTKQNIELIPTAPFNFNATLHKPDHFPAADTRWEPGTRWQTMLWRGKPLGLRFENQGTVARPRIALSIWSAQDGTLLHERPSQAAAFSPDGKVLATFETAIDADGETVTSPESGFHFFGAR